MPIYEYVCPACGYEFEELVKINTEVADCPKCGSNSKRAISMPSPLKKGAFPFKLQPPRPSGPRINAGPSCEVCGNNCSD